MAVKYKGKPKYGRLGLTLPFNLDEGRVKEVEGTRIGGDSNNFVFEKPVNEHDFVALTAAGNVKKADAGDTIIGMRVSASADFPRVEPNRGSTNLDTWFTFQVNGENAYRYASIEVMGVAVRSVKVNDAVVAGDYVKYAGDNSFAKAGEGKVTSAVVLKPAEANTVTAVLFGFKPVIEQ